MWPTRTSSGAAPIGPRRRHGARDVVACRRAVDAGAGAVPHAADPPHAVRPTRGDRLGAPHRVDLRRAKGAARLQPGPPSQLEQFVLHQQLTDLGLQPTIVFVPGIRRPALQAGLAPRPETDHATAKPAPP